MTLPIPVLTYSTNGGPTFALANGATANIQAGAILVLGIQTTTGIQQATWTIRAPGTAIDGASLQTPIGGPFKYTIQLPVTPVTMTVSTAVSDGNNSVSVLNTLLALGAGSAQNSQGIVTAVAASSTAYLEYNAADFGTLVGGGGGDPVANRVAWQAAIQAAISDPGRRPAVLPRPTNGSLFYDVDQPIIINDTVGGTAPLTVRHEHSGIQIRCLVASDGYIIRPAVVAPTPTLLGGFWMVPINTNNFIILDKCPTLQLNGRSGFSIQFSLKVTSGSPNAKIMGWNGSRSHGEAATNAFSIGLGNAGQIAISYTNTNAGAASLTGATNLTVGTQYYIEANFDGTHWRIFVNGVQDAIATLGGADTISMGWETILFGGQGSLWPYSQSTAPVATAMVGNLQIRNSAVHTSNYTPPATETTTASDGDMLILSFAPNFNGTSAVNNVGSIVAQFNLLTECGLPATSLWLLWGAAAQGPGVILENLAVTNGSPGTNSGLYLEASPLSRITRYVGGQMTIYNNAYEIIIRDLHITVTSQLGFNANDKQPKSWGLLLAAGGPQSVYDSEILAGDVSMVLFQGGYLYGRHYLLPQGAIQLLVQSSGSECDFHLDGYAGNDESKLTSDAALLFTGETGLTSLPGTAHPIQGSTTAATTVDLTVLLLANLQFQYASQPGIWYTVQSITSSQITTTVPYTGTSAPTTQVQTNRISTLRVHMRGSVSVLQTAAQGLIWIDGGTEYTFECSPWTAAQLGSYVFKFLNPPSGMVTIRGSQHVDHSNGTPAPWMPPTGSAGQGLVYVENQQTGKLLKYACPDSAYTLAPNEFTWGSVAPVGVLTAARTHTLPLIAGYVWKIVNMFQTGTPQSVTYKCFSDPGSGVTVAAGKTAIVACYDVTQGLVRVTPDT